MSASQVARVTGMSHQCHSCCGHILMFKVETTALKMGWGTNKERGLKNHFTVFCSSQLQGWSYCHLGWDLGWESKSSVWYVPS
jgi:hypothetical protein